MLGSKGKGLLVILLLSSLIVLFTFWVTSDLSEEEEQSFGIISMKDARDVSSLLSYIPEVDYLLLGESTHGTHEFYITRLEVTKQMIKRGDASFIAVEGDWASILRLNDYIMGGENSQSPEEIFSTFSRWPTWMWANEEVLELVHWLREWNQVIPVNERVPFYGMDVYGQWEALDHLMKLLGSELSFEPEFIQQIEQWAQCFSQFRPDEWAYARAVVDRREEVQGCQENLAQIVQAIKEADHRQKTEDIESYSFALQSAYVLKNAEKFYRLSAMQRSAEAWNSRVLHMFESTERFHSWRDGKVGLVWAHNTHVGDARATTMAQQNQVNIGQLTREKYGEDNVYILGLSTYQGEVVAGRQWGEPGMVMNIPSAINRSIESYFYNNFDKDVFFIDFSRLKSHDKKIFEEVKGHRAVGVVYDPLREERNYVPTVMKKRYDGLIFFESTQALMSLD